jgi:hypothetical protein
LPTRYDSGVPRYSYEEIVERIRRGIRDREETPKSVQMAAGISKDKWSRKMRGAGSTFTFEELSLISTYLHAPAGWPFVDWEYADGIQRVQEFREARNTFGPYINAAANITLFASEPLDQARLEETEEKIARARLDVMSAEKEREAAVQWFESLPVSARRRHEQAHQKNLAKIEARLGSARLHLGTLQNDATGMELQRVSRESSERAIAAGLSPAATRAAQSIAVLEHQAAQERAWFFSLPDEEKAKHQDSFERSIEAAEAAILGHQMRLARLTDPPEVAAEIAILGGRTPSPADIKPAEPVAHEPRARKPRGKRR